MRVLVTGGRDYGDARKVQAVLDGLDIDYLAHGGAKGADSLAEQWADRRDVSQEVYFADWNRNGRAAGPIRNQRMLDEFRPDLVVAFPGGRGTAHMVKIARKAGVEVMEVQ